MDSTTAPVTVPPPEDDSNGQLGTADRTAVEASEHSLSSEINREADTADKTDDELSREEKLKEQLLRQALENPEAIRKLLETASDSMKEILLWVLEVIGEGYDEALDNLE